MMRMLLLLLLLALFHFLDTCDAQSSQQLALNHLYASYVNPARSSSLYASISKSVAAHLVTAGPTRIGLWARAIASGSESLATYSATSQRCAPHHLASTVQLLLH